MTNATKALVTALANAILALVVAFGWDATDAQIAAILGVTNCALALWVGLTYKRSPKRIPDA